MWRGQVCQRGEYILMDLSLIVKTKFLIHEKWSRGRFCSVGRLVGGTLCGCTFCSVVFLWVGYFCNGGCFVGWRFVAVDFLVVLLNRTEFIQFYRSFVHSRLCTYFCRQSHMWSARVINWLVGYLWSITTVTVRGRFVSFTVSANGSLKHFK